MTRDVGGETGGTVHGAPRLTADVVRRDRLLRRLDERAPLTVVRSPGGSGKTVLVADWARTAGVPGVWVTVDSSTGTRERLWSAVAALAVRHALVPEGAELARLADSVAAVPDLCAVLRRGFGELTAPLHVVLDDFHHLDNADRVAEDVVDLLLACPRLSVVVVTRRHGRLEDSLTAARIDRVLITADDLRLTRTETAEVLAAAGVRTLDDTAVVHRASGGSPLLVRALARGFGVAEDLTSDAVAQAVVGDLLRGLPPPMRAFMVRTAIPESFDLELAEQLCPGDDAAALLEEVKAQGMLMRLDHVGGATFRYPPLFREVLLEAAPVELGAEVIELHRVSAQWAGEHSSPKTAVGHAVAAGDLHLVSEILLAHGAELAVQSDVYPLLAHLRPRAVTWYPLVAFLIGVGAYVRRGRRHRASAYLGVARRSARLLGQRGTLAERVAHATVESAAARFLARPADGVPAARRALRLLRADPASLAPLRGQAGDLRLQNALTLLRAGHLEEARAGLADNLAELADLPVTTALSTISTDAALAAMAGDVRTAAEALTRVDDEGWATAIRDGYAGASYHLARAVLALERLDLAEARRHAGTLTSSRTFSEFRPHGFAIEILVDLAEGRPVLGGRRLEHFLRDAGAHQLAAADRRVLGPVCALAHLARGQVGHVEHELASLPQASAPVVLLRALCALLTSDHDRVVSLLAPTRPELSSPRAAAVAHLVMAASSLRAGREDVAAAALEQLAAVMADSPLQAHLALVPPQDLRSLQRLADERGLEPAASCLDVRNVPAVVPEHATTAALTERERVVLRALVDSSSHAAIADRLVVSPNTVKSQLRSIYRKLGVTRREDALAAAYAQGLFDLPVSMGVADTAAGAG